MSKTIITVAPTGGWGTKEQNPNFPIHPKEIAEEVYNCWKAGAAIAHIHVRDDQGKPTMSLEKFSETVERIRDKCDIILNLTTSGDLEASDEERMEHLIKLKPDMASFDCGSMNWMHNTLFINHPKFLEKLGRTMIENGIKPEIEIFDSSFIYNAEHYIKIGALKPPFYFQFVLGAPGGASATVENLVHLKRLLPDSNAHWSAFGISKGHLPILMATISMGGHVRVGMEDTLNYSYGRLAKSNVELVDRAVRLIKEADKTVASCNEARTILNLHNTSVHVA